MKKIALIITLFLSFTALTAGNKLWIYETNGTRTAFEEAYVDSVTFVEPGTLILSETEKIINYAGGRFSVAITANQPWTATVDDPTALTLSAKSGTGNATINIGVATNYNDEPYTAKAIFRLQDGTVKHLIVTVKASLTVSPTTIYVPRNKFDYNTIIIETTENWYASCNEPWVTITPQEGIGNAKITLDTDKASETSENDTAHIIISNNITSKEVKVIRQKPKEYTITLKISPCGTTIPAISGSFNEWPYGKGSLPMTQISDTEWIIRFCAEIHDGFKFQDSMLGWENEIKQFDFESGYWGVFSNYILGNETNLIFDYSDTNKYRWSNCINE